MSFPLNFYLKVAGLCFLVGVRWQSMYFCYRRRLAFRYLFRESLGVQVGAGMEAFMIRTGFYDKYDVSTAR